MFGQKKKYRDIQKSNPTFLAVASIVSAAFHLFLSLSCPAVMLFTQYNLFRCDTYSGLF